MKNLQYQARCCDCCGSDKLEEVWSYKTKAHTKSGTYLWDVRNVVCCGCGFAFVSPCPTESSLTDYYTNSYEFWGGQPLDFCIDKRVALLRKHVSADAIGSFVEVGGNASERFASAIAPLVRKYTNVEINGACGSEHRSLSDLPGQCADVLGAYFVLEHVSSPATFLGSCASALKDDGLLIVEVPNLYIYPVNPAGLGWWEHTNHFSPLSLTAMAAAQGLRLAELSYGLCSRPFGFAAVFVKSGAGADKRHFDASAMRPCEYQLAKACMKDGLKVIETYQSHLEEVRGKIRDVGEAGERVVIWAANKVCTDLLEEFQLPDTAVVVDSNPGKRDYLKSVPVYQPDEMTDVIRSAKLIVINTRQYADKIIDCVRDKRRGKLSTDEIVVIQHI